jgi:hypothetical protein
VPLSILRRNPFSSRSNHTMCDQSTGPNMPKYKLRPAGWLLIASAARVATKNPTSVYSRPSVGVTSMAKGAALQGWWTWLKDTAWRTRVGAGGGVKRMPYVLERLLGDTPHSIQPSHSAQ